MEVDEVEIAPDDDMDMEVDIISWEVRDAILVSRLKAIRLRRARFQRKTLLASIAENLEARNRLITWAKELLLNLWWKEQMTRTEYTMVQGAHLNITASWGIGQDSLKIIERGEVSGRGKLLEWELSLKVIPIHEYVEVIKNKIVGEIADLIVDKAWGNLCNKESQAEDLKTAFKGLNIEVPHEPDDCEIEPVDNGILPTTPSPPTSQRPPGHPVGEPGGRQHPPQSPNLQDLRGLVMGLLNARAMLENSFGKTEKVLDTKRITQLNSGCSIDCAEDIGVDKGDGRAREVGREIEMTLEDQDPWGW